MTVEIRQATDADVDAVVALWDSDADPGRAVIDEPADVRRLLSSPSGTLLVAEDGGDDGDIVGTLVAGWDGWRGNLYRLVVRADYRRQGVARDLVGRAEQVLKAQGCPRISALVHLGLREAPSFWPAVGYQHDAEVGRFVRNLD